MKREQACLAAGRLAHDYLQRSGRFDRTKQRLLLLYFVRHLIKVIAIPGHDSRMLAQEILAYMRNLTWNRSRRLAVDGLWLLNRTPLRAIALEFYTRQTAYEFRFQSLRNIVQRFTPEAPPEALQEILRQEHSSGRALVP